jgi:probable DNA repair protein
VARGLEVWATPDIVTWDELIERMFMLDRQAGRLGGRWLPASAAQLLWERIVRDDPELSPLLSSSGVARAAAQSWRRLHDFRVPFAALDDDQSAETAAFSRWCREYRRLLEERNWTDGALAQSRVHARAAAPGLELTGFDRLTPLQESLLQEWAVAGLEVRLAKSPDVVGQCWRTQCLDPAAEIDAAARWAAEHLDGKRARRVAIVVPDLAHRRDEVRRIIERVVVPATGLSGGPAPESQAFELAAARPLAEQPVVAAALDLLDAFVRPPDLPALSRLLRNPFVAGAEEESAARARLDARLRRYESPGLGLTALEHMAAERGCPLLAGTLAAARAAMSVWFEKDSPSNCSKSVSMLLAALGWPGSSPDSTEYQTEQRWCMLVAELGGCDEFTGRVTRAEAAGLLREMAGGVLFEPQELRAPLLVIDPETCAGMRFDALWVCGLDAARWPPPTTPDPFLPRLAQLSQRMPRASAEIAAQDAQATLQRLLASAAEVMLSVAEIEDDAPLLPSPLLDGIEMLAAPAQWPESRLAEALYTDRPEVEALVDAELPPINADEAQRGGARLLELQAACPFRAQAELRLGARALEEPGVGVDAAERGDLIHRALAVLWQELGDQQALNALDPSGVVVAVRRAVATALDEARRSADDLMRHLLDLEADWLAARVLEMIDVDRARAPFVVEAVEAPRKARLGALTLDLRLDRVDRLADGSLAVIDYKTGANAEIRAWLDERPKLPQMPAYVQALGPEQVGAVAFARVRSGDTGYVGLARTAAPFPGLKVPGTRGWPRDYDSWPQLLAAWQRRLEALAAEYAAGDARLAPDPPQACEYCHLGALCRIAETGAAKPGEEAADE